MRMGLAGVVMAAFPSLALAQPAPAGPNPPGEGMIDQPCPAQEGLGFNHPYVLKYDLGWMCRYKAENAALIAAKTPVKAVFIGDSITQGWANDKSLFSGGIVGRGIGGQTSPQMVLRFEQDVVALRPAIVHIMAGTNDIAGNTGPNSPEDYKNAIRAMVDIARAHGITVIVGSIPPADLFPWKPQVVPTARVAELNAWLKALAAEQGLVYADYFTALSDGKGAMRPGMASDHVHPTPAGYAVMDEVARKALAEAEAKARR